MALPWVKKKIFADALAWSASIAVHRAAVPCETPGAWQLPLLFGALPSWERALEKEWSNPSFDHLQLRKTKEKEKKSFSRLPRFNPKLSAYGLRPIAHNFGPHRDFTRSLLSFLLLKNLPPPPHTSPRDTLPPLLPYLWAGSV